MMDQAQREEFDELLADAIDNASSDWECDFVDSIEKQAENPFWEPSEKQWEKLRSMASDEDPDRQDTFSW